jgi:hypothetical protein
MAIANYFYNETTRKYVALFGTMFNQIKIKRKDNSGTEVHSQIVPLSYAPFQKVLSRLNEDPDLLNSRRTAIQLPRMSFEITSFLYDPSRKIASTHKMRKESKAEVDSSKSFMYASVPYNIEFSLYIMTKYSEDATQIMEQIIPFFTPDWTVTAKMVPDLDPVDIPIILNSVTTEDLYEGDYVERQSILYTLNFTLKGWYFGPEKQKKVIKFVDVDMAADTLANTSFAESVEVYPVDIANTAVGWADIEFDDNWEAKVNYDTNLVSQEPFVTDIIPGTANTDLDSGNTSIDLDSGYGIEDLN